MINKSNSRLASGSIALGFLLLLSSCGSDDAVAATDSTQASGDAAALETDASGDGADAAQNTFVLAAEASCSDTRLAVDALFVEGGELSVEPQVAVAGIAEHFHQLYDEVSAIEADESVMSEPTESYLAAVLSAAEEADAAQETSELSTTYLAAHSEKLTAVNDAGDVLGIQACAVRFAEDA